MNEFEKELKRVLKELNDVAANRCGGFNSYFEEILKFYEDLALKIINESENQKILKHFNLILKSDTNELKKRYKEALAINPDLSESLDYLIEFQSGDKELDPFFTSLSEYQFLAEIVSEIGSLFIEEHTDHKGIIAYEEMIKLRRLQWALCLKITVDELKPYSNLTELSQAFPANNSQYDYFAVHNLISLGYFASRLDLQRFYESDLTKDMVRSILSKKDMDENRYPGFREMREEAKKIAMSIYESGDRRFHTEVTDSIYDTLLNRRKKEHPRLKLDELTKKIPSKVSIRDVVKPIADQYGCVRGKKGVTKKS